MTLEEKDITLKSGLQRLQRELLAVQRGKHKLKSYRCEPKDYKAFKLQQQLQENLNRLFTKQQNRLEAPTSATTELETELLLLENLHSEFRHAEKVLNRYLKENR